MIGGLFAVLAIVVIGGRATDGLRRAEAEDILARLPEADAVAYYHVIRRRVRRVVLMRVLALIALLWIMLVLRQRLGQRADDAQPRTALHGQAAGGARTRLCPFCGRVA